MNTLPTLSWATFREFKPCYNPLMAYGEWSGTILDLLKRNDIPARDQLWAVTRPGILDNRMHKMFSDQCIEQFQINRSNDGWDMFFKKYDVQGLERIAATIMSNQITLFCCSCKNADPFTLCECSSESFYRKQVAIYIECISKSMHT